MAAPHSYIVRHSFAVAEWLKLRKSIRQDVHNLADQQIAGFAPEVVRKFAWDCENCFVSSLLRWMRGDGPRRRPLQKGTGGDLGVRSFLLQWRFGRTFPLKPMPLGMDA
jgi:hypothetical protein